MDNEQQNQLGWTRLFANGLIHYRWILLGFILTLVAVAYFPAQRLDFDRSIENMFRRDDPLLPSYQQLKRTFGGDDVVLVAYVDPQLMTERGIERVKQLTDLLAGIRGVKASLSLSTTPLGTNIISDSFLGPRYLELFESFHVGVDEQTTAVACILETGISSADQVRIVDEIRNNAEAHDRNAVLVGGPVMVVEGFRLVEKDGHQLGWLSSLLLGLTLLLCFRSLLWVVIALVIVNATLVLTEALLVLTQFRLTIVSSMLWSNVTVVGIATVIHVVVKFSEAQRDERSSRVALLFAVATLATPVMWTCLTDAVGFASLLVAEVAPVRDFGFMMVWASLIAMVSLACFLPGLVLLWRRNETPRLPARQSFLDASLRWLIDLVLARPVTILIMSAVVVIAAGLGCSFLEFETDFTRNFRQSSRIVQSYALVESNLGGAGVWDVIVPAPPPESLDTRYLRRLRRLEKHLLHEVKITGEHGEAIPGVTKVMSLANCLDTAPTPRFLPQDVLVRVKYRLFNVQMPFVAQQLYAEDPEQPGKYFARMMLRSKERQASAQKKQLIHQVTVISRQHFPQDGIQPAAQVTGFFVLLANLIDSVVRDQWVTLSIAILAVGTMMVLAFRSLRLAAIAIIPNIIPIAVVMGLMGWLGLRINMGAAMIAAVSMGLSVDSEIHYITAFQRLMHEGHSVREALYAVQRSVGRAVAFATLALTVGFGALCVSDFVPTIYFGGLVSLSIVGGLFGNLIILPLFLCFSTPAQDKS